MKQDYSSKDIRVLEEIEHIRLNSGMYIGSTNNPVHLIEEVLDNALDEALAGYANIIAVLINTKENKFAVLDNGRGIPISNNTPVIISSKLFSGAKFQDKKTVYEISCLRGNTKIFLLNGKEITIKEMVDNPNNEYWGLSSTTDGQWKANKFLNPRVTGKTKKFIRVYLDNDLSVDCTENHLFLLRNGSYKKAADLIENDSLMPLYKKTDSNKYTQIRSNNTYPYLRNLNFKNRVFIPLHQIVYDSLNGIPPKYFAVHHIDLNRKNNYPNNLLLLHNHTEHPILHAKLRSEKGDFPYPDKLVEYSKSEKGRKKSRENGLTVGKNNLLKYIYSDNNRENKRNQMTKYSNNIETQKGLQKQKCLKYCKSLLINNLEINEEIWEKYRPYGVVKYSKIFNRFNTIKDLIIESDNYKYNTHELVETNGKMSIIKRMISILKKVYISNLPLTEDSFNLVRKRLDPTIKAVNTYFGSFDNFVEYYKTNNHKVKRIEIIELNEEEEVYDLTSPIYENFALDCGIVVHNSGLHGIGLVAVNALSTNYKIEIYRKEQYARYLFEDAKLKFSKIEEYKNKGTPPFSTKIEFQPDKKYFETLKPDLDRIRKRLTTASAEMQDGITFVLIVDDKKELFRLTKIDHFVMSCLDSRPEQIEIINLKSEKAPEKFEVILSYEKESSTTPRLISSVNLLPVIGGGSHVNYFYDTLKEFFAAKAKKYDIKFQPNDSLCSLRAYLMLSLIEPKFSSQTKESLINPKTYFEKFDKDLKLQLEDFATKNEDMLLDLLEKFQEYRQRLDSKKLTVDRTNGRRASTKYTKLRDCTSKHGELYIVEGDSAGGSILQSRNPTKHAVLPLRGKSIPNVTTKKEILKNVEVSELIMSMGCGVGPHFDLTKLRYSKIVCATDADHDGAHIACLVSMVMAILLPEIVKSGHYFIAQTPLFAINEGKTFIPLWTIEDVDKARKTGRKIQRYKGLGEMNPSQLKVTLLDEATRNLTPIKYTENIDDLIKLFSSADEKRKLVVGE